MHIGLIGGVGPAATIAYYTKLIEAFNNADLALELTIAHADITKLPPNAAANKKQEQAQIFAIHLNQLAGAGCDVAMITALTGHFCFEETEEISPVALIDGTGLIDKFCRKQGINAVGLLGGPSVLATHLFGRLKYPRTITPKSDLSLIGDTYMQLAQSGRCTKNNRQILFKAGAEMVNELGAEAVLLAGTDLGLAFDGQTVDYRVIDALDIHVAALVEMAKAQ